ncbi:MAG: 4Fe-4S binding protein [Desulfovibrio sp.]|nr:4Fe-4S binding protein [Desulfovibrio sp.]
MEALTINTGWCKGCGICVAFCPRKALKLVGEKCSVDPERCVLCGMCELYCPDLAISIDPGSARLRKEKKHGRK